MARARTASTWRRIGSTLLAAALLVGVGAVAAYSLAQLDIGPPFGGRIPAVAYDAYRSAEEAAAEITESCRVEWQVVAAIAQVESRHGRIDSDHRLDRDGTVEPPIRGQQLDGTRRTQTIVDTDDGELDGDPDFDRAMGPLQFIPTTWRELGRDGNGDGSADPDNLYDAALTTVAHLCLREPGDYTARSELRRALIAYNASGRYADDVLRWVDRYRSEPLDAILEPVSYTHLTLPTIYSV